MSGKGTIVLQPGEKIEGFLLETGTIPVTIIASTSAITKALPYLFHIFDCDLLVRKRMSYIAEITMEQVLGPAKCTCGFNELKTELANLQE